MNDSPGFFHEDLLLEAGVFQAFLDALTAAYDQVIGPTVRDGAVVYAPIADFNDLPQGVTDQQRPAAYRLAERDDDAFFGYTLGANTWKAFLHPARVRLWRALRADSGFSVESEPAPTERVALLGVRACELAAIAVQDAVFINESYVDPVYASRRENVFIVAVNCGQVGANCFCTSMGTGPGVTGGYDLALTEVITAESHHFVVRVGSEAGAALMRDIPHRIATDDEIDVAHEVVEDAAASIQRTLETDGLKDALMNAYESPRWDEVAERCMACANCTMVCPTCFCTTVEDVTDLTGTEAERWRAWDSCFTMDFSYIHGGSVRYSRKARYRQWLTHKLATWWEQFGTSGCVGCGRCITWCPVGIDITEEAAAVGTSARGERTTT